MGLCGRFQLQLLLSLLQQIQNFCQRAIPLKVRFLTSQLLQLTTKHNDMAKRNAKEGDDQRRHARVQFFLAPKAPQNSS